MNAAPRLARWLLAALTPRRDRDQFLADIDEEFAVRVAQHGPVDARRWFWKQTLFSLPSLSFHLLTARPPFTQRRGGPPLERVMQDLQWAIRALRKNAGFTSLALLTLTLGIGATTAAFAVLDAVLLRPMPYPQAERLVILEEMTLDRSTLPPSYPNFDDWRTASRSFEHVAATNRGLLRATLPTGAAVRVMGLGVSRDFFETLRVAPVVGRTFTAGENTRGGPNVLMVSYEFWQTHLGGATALGGVRLGAEQYQIIGVLPPGFQFMRTYDVFYPLERYPNEIRTAHYLTVTARLANGVALASARTEMTALARRFVSAYGNATQAEDVAVTPMREHFVGGYRRVLRLVLAAAALVLLVACTNLVSAQLARGVVRGREIAVRAALGAPRRRLLRQLLVESTLLAAIGGVLGILLGVVLTGAIRRFGAGLMPRIADLTIDVRVMAFTALSVGVVAVLIGAYPALRLANRDPASSLRAGGRTNGTAVRASVWRMLVGFEIAMAVVLVAGSTLLLRTLQNILENDTGFDVPGVVTASLSTGDASLARVENVRADLAALPGVGDVALVNQLPLNWVSWSAPLTRPTDPLDRDWPAFAGFRVVTPNYFDVLRLPILQGRAFTDTDREGQPRVAIVTPGIAAKLWPNESPLGKLVRSNQAADSMLTVVGVVAEATAWQMARGGQNEIYVPLRQHPGWHANAIAVIRANGDASAIMSATRRMFRDIQRDIPVTVALLEDRVAASAASQRFATFAIVAFGGIALLLAIIGIYGVLAYTVTSRRFEIGVRMALGATGGRVLGEMLRGAAIMATFGIVAGVVSAFGATKLLRGLLYGVAPTEPTAYVIGSLVLFAAALVGAYLPARRASRVDPLLAMRVDG